MRSLTRRSFVNVSTATMITWRSSLAETRAAETNGKRHAPNKIGILSSGSEASFATSRRAYIDALTENGYREGIEFVIESRWAKGDYSLLDDMALDLLKAGVAVLFVDGNQAAFAARRATRTVPIVFILGGDPVAYGLVETIGRPGGNATGVSYNLQPAEAKKIELMREVLPGEKNIGVLINPKNATARKQEFEARVATEKTGAKAIIVFGASEADVLSSLDRLAAEGVRVLSVTADASLVSKREFIAQEARNHKILLFASNRDFAEAGALISYGANRTEAYKQAGAYTANIMKGQDPAGLPIYQPTKNELVLNLRTADALGISFSPAIMLRADELIGP